MKTFEGKLVSKEIKIGIVASSFNEFITAKLLGGAMDGLIRHDVREEDIHVAWVPGAFEIPLIASQMAKSGKYDAVICLVSLVLLSFASSPPLDPHPANIVPIMAALSNAAKTFFFIVVASVS